MKKIICSITIFLMLANTVVLSKDNYENPFDNGLFKVVAEAQLPGALINVDFEGVRIVPDSNGKSYKAVAHTISYDGKLTQKDLCDFTTIEQAQAVMNSSKPAAKEPTFNDGLELFSDGMGFYGYRNIENKAVHSIDENSTKKYDYNLGLIYESQGTQTTFTAVMSDNTVYRFNVKINNFNDDGYAIMNANGRYYVVRLKNGIIPTVFYNGEKIKFDRIPIIENGRTLVPLRAIFEAFGASVNWNQQTKTVTSYKDGTKITLKVGDTTAYKNSKAIILDVPARVENGRTLVPVRFIAECLGIKVDWNQEMKQVVMISQ